MRKYTYSKFKELGGREVIAKRVLQIAYDMLDGKHSSYKRSIVGMGQLAELAKLCTLDDYWSEKVKKGMAAEQDNIKGGKLLIDGPRFNANGDLIGE